mmetsp:Transcript_7862/g.11307  ORF Transcript_7862/g.11307 Transcript_7862/m.11307 type:complete len:124 (+) Transcript_7862:316-687(+)
MDPANTRLTGILYFSAATNAVADPATPDPTTTNRSVVFVLVELSKVGVVVEKYRNLWCDDSLRLRRHVTDVPVLRVLRWNSEGRPTNSRLEHIIVIGFANDRYYGDTLQDRYAFEKYSFVRIQ